MLLGDITADDRDNRINMHRSDYLLRDVSRSWQQLAAMSLYIHHGMITIISIMILVASLKVSHC